MRLKQLLYTTRTYTVGTTTCILPEESGYAARQACSVRVRSEIYIHRAMCSFILIFLACVIFIHGWNKPFLDHIFIKTIFSYSGTCILYFVMNYRIKALLNCKFPSYRLLIDYMTILMLYKIFTPLKNEIMTSLRIIYNVLALS